MHFTSTYVPKPHSAAWRALAVLTEKSGSWMASIDLAQKISVANNGIASLLAPGVIAGVFEKKKINTRIFYRLGPQAVAMAAATLSMPPEDVPPAPPPQVFIPRRSIFDAEDRVIPMPRGATFGVLADGRINIARDGKTTEQLSPKEATTLLGVLRARSVDQDAGRA